MFSIILLSLFLIGMIIIGFWGMKKTTTLNDFFLGGRSIGPWISAFAYGTTYFSAVMFIGFAGKLGWGFGFDCLWLAVGNAFVGSLAAWLILGKRTRRMTQNLDVMTMPEFLHERFEGVNLKIFAAAIVFLFLLPYSASVFKGLSHLFEANFHMPYDIALLIMIGITGLYLILGGYFAVTLTDFIQGIVMIGGSIAMVLVLVSKGGGFNQVIQSVLTNYPQHIPAAKHPSGLMLFALFFITSFGVWGMPQMVQKFYSIKNEKFIVKAAIVSTIFAVIITFSAYFVGAISHAFLSGPPIVNGVPVFDRLIPQLLTTYLPNWLMAVILLLVLSASMSTLASLILVSASAVAIDLYKGHVNPKISKERSLLMMRFLSGIFIVLSYFIARHEFSVIVTLMSLSWGVIAGAFMAPYVYGLFWKRTTKCGVQAGMVTGVFLAIFLFYKMGSANAPIASMIAMVVPFIVVPVVSLMTRPPSKARLEKAFQ